MLKVTFQTKIDDGSLPHVVINEQNETIAAFASKIMAQAYVAMMNQHHGGNRGNHGIR